MPAQRPHAAHGHGTQRALLPAVQVRAVLRQQGDAVGAGHVRHLQCQRSVTGGLPVGGVPVGGQLLVHSRGCARVVQRFAENEKFNGVRETWMF